MSTTAVAGCEHGGTVRWEGQRLSHRPAMPSPARCGRADGDGSLGARRPTRRGRPLRGGRTRAAVSPTRRKVMARAGRGFARRRGHRLPHGHQGEPL